MAEKFPINDAEACQTGSGTTFGYRIEARLNYARPEEVCGMLLDNRWREISTRPAGPDGIWHRRAPQLDQANLFPREAAEALRWQFIAGAEATRIGGSHCIETRLVKYKLEYRFSATPVAYVSPQDCRGDVPKDMMVDHADESAAREAGQ